MPICSRVFKIYGARKKRGEVPMVFHQGENGFLL